MLANHLNPTHSDFWFVPLGGTGEIGMNLNLYGHAASWLMVDCGATFKVPLDPSLDHDPDVRLYDVVIPDPQFIIERKDDLSGIVITHAHEDHIGALTQVWPQLLVPIYTTAFTAEVIRRKFYRAGIHESLPLVVVEPGMELDLGPFTVRWLPITHSIPETQALLITTGCGTVLHTADWKIDYQPVVGARLKSSRFKALGRQPILAMVCDSTNALREQAEQSEYTCQQGLLEVVKAQRGRVVVTCFASNVARLVSIAQVAAKTGRYLALFGRALENMMSIARQLDYWPDELTVIPSRHIGYLPAHEVIIAATGCQGEPRAAMSQLARGRHRHCLLGQGDTVIFSSIIIPGNEAYVERIVQQLHEQSVTTIQQSNTDACIHVSGHPCAEDLRQMYNWVNPQCAVPTHGEMTHMHANAQVAAEQGIDQQLVGKNGDVFVLSPAFETHKGAVPVGRIALEER